MEVRWGNHGTCLSEMRVVDKSVNCDNIKKQEDLFDIGNVALIDNTSDGLA